MDTQRPQALSDAARLRLRETFSTDAARYAARRPSYPDALFERLATYGGLDEGARVLEIAPGTGQATRSLAERGWNVTAVELGEQMAAAARHQLAGFHRVTVLNSGFEDWPLPAEPFDAVVCATAWHWLDPNTRITKAVQAVRPNGTVAVVWTHHVAGGTAEFFADAQNCYRRFDPHFEDDDLQAESSLIPTTDEQSLSAALTDVESRQFPLEISYSTEEYLDLLSTYSTTIRLTPGQRERLLGCLGELIDGSFHGRIIKRYAFELVTARRITPRAR